MNENNKQNNGDMMSDKFNANAAIEAMRSAKRMVFFGGAGTSTESGIPDFRSSGGLFAQAGYPFPPEQMLSRSFFDADPELFFKFYKEQMIHSEAMPNQAHYALVELEKRGILQAIITQNIDGLHQKAGSSAVYELHGSVHRNYCMRCKTPYSLNYIMSSAKTVPYCTSCTQKSGGEPIIKPDVVLYGEELDNETIEKSIEAIVGADVLLIGGTSLTVYPAGGFIDYFRGEHLIIVNKATTKQDHKADFVINESIAGILHQVVLY